MVYFVLICLSFGWTHTKLSVLSLFDILFSPNMTRTYFKAAIRLRQVWFRIRSKCLFWLSPFYLYLTKVEPDNGVARGAPWSDCFYLLKFLIIMKLSTNFCNTVWLSAFKVIYHLELFHPLKWIQVTPLKPKSGIQEGRRKVLSLAITFNWLIALKAPQKLSWGLTFR